MGLRRGGLKPHHVRVSFPTDDLVHPDDIENMARAVLSIRLPRSPDQVRSMIDEINNLLSNASRFQEELKKLEEHTNITQELLRKAEDVKLVSQTEKNSTEPRCQTEPSTGLCW